jgi:DNA-binding transcriptional LysR family regulator
MQLTFAGESFLEYAQEIVQYSHSLQQHMLQFSSQQKQQLCLWCNSSAQSEYLPKILPEYLLQNSQLQIELQEAESSEIITALTQGTAQLGLVSSFLTLSIYRLWNLPKIRWS